MSNSTARSFHSLGEQEPLELSEDGHNEAMRLIENFKSTAIKALEDAVGDLYCDVMPYIESDSWLNFRSQVLGGIKGCTPKISDYDFKAIRRKMFEDYREEIIDGINQDNLDEIEALKRQLEKERQWRR